MVPVYGPLTIAEQLLMQAVATGQALDVRAGEREHDDPANAHAWHPQRTVRGELIVSLVLDRSEDDAARSVVLVGAKVTGPVDLAGVATSVTLRLASCAFSSPIVVRQSALPTIVLADSQLPRLVGRLAHIAGDVNLRGTRIGEVDLSVASVGGALNLTEAQLGEEGQDGPALFLDGASLQSVRLDWAAVRGGALLEGLHVQGDVMAENATFDALGGIALAATHLRVDRNFIAPGLSARGDLALADMKIRGLLALPELTVTGTTTLIGSEIGELVLRGGRLVAPAGRALRADRITVDRAIFAEGVHVVGQMRMADVRVGGALDLSEAVIRHDAGHGFVADRMTAAVLSLSGVQVSGGISLAAAHIAGQLLLSGARIEAEGEALFAELIRLEHGLRADGMRAEGDVNLWRADIRGICDLHGAKVLGGVLWLAGAHIAELTMSGVRVEGRRGAALAAEGLVVDQDVVASRAVLQGGSTSMIAATIGGSLLMPEAALHHPEGNAWWADRAVIRGSINCDGAVFAGNVRLLGATVGRQLLAREVRFDGVPVALNGDGLRVDGDLFVQRATAAGRVRLIGAQVLGQLSLDGVDFRASGVALTAEGLVVGENASVEDVTSRGLVSFSGARFKGRLTLSGRFLPREGTAITFVRALAAQECRLAELYVEGDVVLDDARFDGGIIVARSRVLGDVSANGMSARAVVLDGLVVRRGVTERAGSGGISCFGLVAPDGLIAGRGSATDGGVDILRAEVGGQLMFVGAYVGEQGGHLRLNDSVVNGTLYLDVRVPRGAVDLRGVTATVLEHPEKAWPPRLELDGTSYDRLDGDTTVRTCGRWLDRVHGYSPQPYQQLASFFRRSGRPEDARAVAIAQQRRRRSQLSRLGRAANRFMDWTVGYGFRPWLAALWLAAFLVPAVLIFDSEHPSDLKPTRDAARVPEFDPILYAVDVLVPVISLNHRDAWAASGSAQTWVLVFTVAGWALTTALVAGLTGVLRRD